MLAFWPNSWRQSTVFLQLFEETKEGYQYNSVRFLNRGSILGTYPTLGRKGSGLFLSGYDLPFIKKIQSVWEKIGPYAKARLETQSTKTTIEEADVEGLKFLHAFGPFRLKTFTSMEEYMRQEALPIGVSILEGAGGLGGKNTAFYTHSISQDNYKYSSLS